jgi:hypothetical protein
MAYIYLKKKELLRQNLRAIFLIVRLLHYVIVSHLILSSIHKSAAIKLIAITNLAINWRYISFLSHSIIASLSEAVHFSRSVNSIKKSFRPKDNHSIT